MDARGKLLAASKMTFKLLASIILSIVMTIILVVLAYYIVVLKMPIFGY